MITPFGDTKSRRGILRLNPGIWELGPGLFLLADKLGKSVWIEFNLSGWGLAIGDNITDGLFPLGLLLPEIWSLVEPIATTRVSIKMRDSSQ